MIASVDEKGILKGTGKISGYEWKIVDSVPDNSETHVYKYEMGEFIDLGEKEATEMELAQQSITDLELEQMETQQQVTELELEVLELQSSESEVNE